MWNYEKRLQYPVNIKTPNAKLAQFISSQYGGPDGEIGASMRYLSQRFTAPNRMVAAVLNDVGTEELAHLEIVSTIVHQLTKDLSMEEIENSGLGPYYIDHTVGIWPQAAGGVPFNACEFQSKGDPITDLFEDLAAEQKARSTYDNILRVVKNIPEADIPIAHHWLILHGRYVCQARTPQCDKCGLQLMCKYYCEKYKVSKEKPKDKE